MPARAARSRADWVVIATGYATPEFKPLPARFRMLNTYVDRDAAARRGASDARSGSAT